MTLRVYFTFIEFFIRYSEVIIRDSIDSGDKRFIKVVRETTK